MKHSVLFRSWLAGILAATVLIAAACAGGQVPVAPADATTPASPPAASNAAGLATGQTVDIVTHAPPPAIVSDAPAAPAATAPAADLDPDAVVAAQEQVLTGIYDAVLPSVVHILVTLDTDRLEGELDEFPFRYPFGDLPDQPERFFQRGEGSGFVWDEQGHLITNQHVVENAERVTVQFADGTELIAEIVGGDPYSDIAVLKVEPPDAGLTPVTVGDSAALKVGQVAVTVGNPFGQDFTMTSGIVSALGRTRPSGLSSYSIPLVIQHDAPINPGSSGGPLLDRRGQVIGINTQIISQSGSSAGIGFAVPINVARKVIPALIEHGEYRYAWLGIAGVDLFPELRDAAGLPEGTRGVLVQSLVAGGPSDTAGLKAGSEQVQFGGRTYAIGGDTIVAIDDAPVYQMSDLINYLAQHTDPGDTATLTVIRGGGERADIAVTLAARPSS